MRFGPLTIQLIALTAIGLASGDVVAQTSPMSRNQPQDSYPAGGNSTASRPIQALFLSPIKMGAASPYVDAYGNSVIVPAGYAASNSYPDPALMSAAPGSGGYTEDQFNRGQGYGYPAQPSGQGGYYDGGCYDGCGDGCGDGGCYDGCGNCGYGNCGCGYGDGRFGGRRPCRVYGTGGGCAPGTCPPNCDEVDSYSLLRPFRTEQCGPHYWDVRMEAVFLTRDETFNQRVVFTSLNVVDPNAPNPDNDVLNSGQLEFDDAVPGFRIMGRYDIGPLSVLEFGYTGVENLDASASFTDPDPVDDQTGNLYSLFTVFVSDPAALPADVTTPGGSFPGTERARVHSITLESELHTAEMSYRRYWVGFSPCVSGTCLAGFRFTRLREDFDFTSVGEATGQYLELIKNDMAGFQAGGDVWVHLARGLRAGAEGKIGLMNNHYTLDNSFTSNDQAQEGVFNEHFEKDIPALITEGSVDVVCDVLPSWSVRAGYEVLFLNSVLLAGENFNTGSIYSGEPNVLLPARVPFVADQGNAFYHGFHIGAEYTW